MDIMLLRTCNECGKEEKIIDKVKGILSIKENKFITTRDGLEFCCPECALEYRERLPLKKKLRFDFQNKLR